jgi:hypothetical protein
MDIWRYSFNGICKYSLVLTVFTVLIEFTSPGTYVRFLKLEPPQLLLSTS